MARRAVIDTRFLGVSVLLLGCSAWPSCWRPASPSPPPSPRRRRLRRHRRALRGQRRPPAGDQRRDAGPHPRASYTVVFLGSTPIGGPDRRLGGAAIRHRRRHLDRGGRRRPRRRCRAGLPAAAVEGPSTGAPPARAGRRRRRRSGVGRVAQAEPGLSMSSRPGSGTVSGRSRTRFEATRREPRRAHVQPQGQRDHPHVARRRRRGHGAGPPRHRGRHDPAGQAQADRSPPTWTAATS